MIVRDKFYIGGEWVTPEGADTLQVDNASTEEIIGTVPAGMEADVER